MTLEIFFARFFKPVTRIYRGVRQACLNGEIIHCKIAEKYSFFFSPLADHTMVITFVTTIRFVFFFFFLKNENRALVV